MSNSTVTCSCSAGLVDTAWDGQSLDTITREAVGRKTHKHPTSCAKQIQNPADLTQLDAIHVLGFDDHWARYLSANDLPIDHVSPRVVVDNSVAACELAAAENGCAIMFERFAQQAIAAGRPLKIVGDPVANGQSHYVIQRNSAPNEKRTSTAFCEWLATCF